MENLDKNGLEYLTTRTIEMPVREIKVHNLRLFYMVYQEYIIILHIAKKEKNATELPDKRLAIKRSKKVLKNDSDFAITLFHSL